MSGVAAFMHLPQATVIGKKGMARYSLFLAHCAPQ
jgi:hypothetical protein